MFSNEQIAASELTKALTYVNVALGYIESSNAQSWLDGTEKIASSLKKIRDGMYAEQGPLELS